MKKPNISKENAIMIGVGTAFAIALIGGCSYSNYYKAKNYEMLQAEALAAEAEVAEEERESYVVGFDYSSLPWQQMGYDNLQVYWDDIQEKRESIKGIADKYIDSYGSSMTEEDKQNLRWYESRMLNAIYSEDFEDAYNDFDSLVSQFIPKTTYYVASSWSGGSAKDFIIYHESRGDYSARNGKYYGAYQMDESRLNGDYSKENQDRVAEQYVADRYGSWENAMAFWQSHGWY